MRNSDAQLAISHEYFLPVEGSLAVLSDPHCLRDDTIYVLPIESLALDQYESIAEAALRSGFLVERTRMANESRGSYLNACAIIYKNGSLKRLLLQPKMYAERHELPFLITGEEFFLIEGQHSALLVLICSDANHAAFHTVWEQELHRKTGSYVLHVQCNPQPDYSHYQNLWQTVLGGETGGHRLFLSLNWGKGSQIRENGTVYEIKRSRSRIMRGRCLQKNARYSIRSSSGLHLEWGRCHSKIWEVWHLLAQEERAFVLEVVPAYETVPAEQASAGSGVLRSSSFILSGDKFVEEMPDKLLTPFWHHCDEYGLNLGAHGDLITALAPCEIERLMHSVLASKDKSWLYEDPDGRSPVAQLACRCQRYSDCQHDEHICCNKRDKWHKDTEIFVQCLRTFMSSEGSAFQVFPTDKYPLNLITPEDSGPTGWLFHCGGRSAESIEREVSMFLAELDLRGRVFLFPVGVAGKITEMGIIRHPNRNISNPMESGHDISNIDHTPKYQIKHL